MNSQLLPHKFSGLLYAIFFILGPLYQLKPAIFACDVPVFRYALERWTADPYRLFIYQADTVDSSLQTDIDDLVKCSFDGDSTLNLLIQSTELNEIESAFLDQHVSTHDYPLMVLFYPEASGIPYPAWYGALSKANLNALKDSPARQMIAQRLLKGEAAVFLFLASGEQETDERFLKLLQDDLTHLTQTIRIPGSAVDAAGKPIIIRDYNDRPLTFSFLKISRNDPAEKIFVSQLLGTESDLVDYQAPMVFPVFGQGRSLYALVGNGINDKTLEKACNSLVAWCSCEIKALHQGVDLLILTDWSKRAGDNWVKDRLSSLTAFSSILPTKSPQNASDIITPDQSDKYEDVRDSEYTDAGKIINKAQSDQSAYPLAGEDSDPVIKNSLKTILILTIMVITLGVIIKMRFSRRKS